ncbi:MAG: NAD(P)-dependent oxidoreductase [Cytophagales bacterium]|nr:NAD(P)-dependent oxidoreductase [Cytophagales bacterium]
MSACLIFGGSGYIGTHMAQYLLQHNIFTTIYIADIKPSSLAGNPNIIFYFADVRKPLSKAPIHHPIDWIFNIAAIHREPGHSDHEYFDTNVNGAKNVCYFAQIIGCNNIFFTSSISPYGPTAHATTENDMLCPNTPYGVSKMQAEYIHRLWQCAGVPAKRLIIARPGVIYGPGDPGNILRMITAIKKGYFFLPGSGQIRKSYGYIYGLCASVVFTMKQDKPTVIYNYVEKYTENLTSMIQIIKEVTGSRAITWHIPMPILIAISKILHAVYPGIKGIHPVRVRKVARPTHIVPQYLIDSGFVFEYDFKTSLVHWRSVSPQDF